MLVNVLAEPFESLEGNPKPSRWHLPQMACAEACQHAAREHERTTSDGTDDSRQPPKKRTIAASNGCGGRI